MKFLYSDERELQERLSELMRDETDIIGTVSHLTEALEVASDVVVEFHAGNRTGTIAFGYVGERS